MNIRRLSLFFILLILISFNTTAQWKLFICNDVCMDYTWCLNEEKVKENMAELMAAHLDAMTATDNQPFENKARYTCTVTNEIFYFLEKYPLRKGELVNRIKEGRIMMSPFLVNTMWGFCGAEGFLRAMYPAKRFAAENNLNLSHAVHSELPSMPWDIIPLLSGSGIGWINKPFLNYDATFGALKNPPVFRWISVSKTSEDINFKIKLEKEIYREEEGIFLVRGLRQKINLQVETTAAITRPYLQPEGDLLPGADSTRIVMQGFVNACYQKDGGILLASPDAFCLKPDRNSIIIELLGNNQNYREAIKDQNNERSFEFRFSLTPYKGLLDPATAHLKGKSLQMPVMITRGRMSDIKPAVEITGKDVKVICRKPADPAFGRGEIFRLQNISANDIIARVHCNGYSSAVLADVLEQDIHPLEIKGGFVTVPVKAYGFAGLRMIK